MENLSREAILRMVGLHDAAHMMRQLNAIQLSLEEEQGQMVAYWTEIRKSEKEITLLAGRVSANETDIGQLQVTAQQITASVSSLTTTVNGHTTSIGQLQITANSLTASVSSISDTVSGHTTKIAAMEITESSISNRVTVIEGDYVKNAQISLMVVKDGNGYISNALIDADDIKFVFTRAVSWYWQSETEANKRMGLDSNGDLWIAGEYKGGSITGNITVGTGTKKMYIEPTSTGARLVGKSGDTEVISLGFYDGTSSHNPQLRMGGSYFSEEHIYMKSSESGGPGTISLSTSGDFGPYIQVANNGNSNTVRFIFEALDNYVILCATDYGYANSRWPTEGVDDISSLPNGTVYLRSDGCLGVR